MSQVAIPGGGTGKNSAYMFRQPGGGYAAGTEAQVEGSGTSIFDPVLCELMYKWFCPAGGQIIDPFAGGSVRGIVASLLGYRYWGCELHAGQVEANRAQAASICPEQPLEWAIGDARVCLPSAPEADFVFTCPPYGDLERYSDDSRDLSTLEYPAFLAAFTEIVSLAAGRLRQNRFFCIVIGDFRDRRTGNYRGFVADTVMLFRNLGLPLYNEALLLTAIGSLPVRVGQQFESGRKLGKTHQNVLLFVKGDGRKTAKLIEEGYR